MCLAPGVNVRVRVRVRPMAAVKVRFSLERVGVVLQKLFHHFRFSFPRCIMVPVNTLAAGSMRVDFPNKVRKR